MSFVARGLAIVLLLGQASLGVIQGADKPDGFTMKHYIREWIAYNRRSMVEAYKAVGHRDPAWDEQAIRFLELQSGCLLQSLANYIYEFPDLPTQTQVNEAAEAVVQTDCDDPLVMDQIALARSNAGRTDEARYRQKKAAAAMVASTYSTDRIANSLRRQLEYLDAKTEPAMVDAARSRLFDADLASVQRRDWQGFDRRVVYDQIYGDTLTAPVPQLRQLLERITASPGDPWLTAMVCGKIHVKLGWEARGCGYADTVTEEGWKQLRVEAAAAEACFEEAYRLHPENPEAAAALEEVGQQTSAGLPYIREWFDKATAAQVDFDPAYHNLLWSMMPRWFGSHEQMLSFACECVDTDRFDTDVPLKLIKTLDQVIHDSADDWSCINTPGVPQAIEKMCNGYAERVRTPRQRRWFISELVGYAWQMRRFDLGAATIKKLNDVVDFEAVQVADVVACRAVSGIHAFTGPLAGQLRSAESAASAGKFADAASAYAAIAKTLSGTDPAALWCRGRAQEFDWQTRLASGSWIELAAPIDLAGWYADSGSWSSDGKTLTARCENDEAVLWCGLRVGSRWELDGTIEVPAAAADPQAGDPLEVGVNYCFNNVKNPNSVRFQPGRRQVTWLWSRSKQPAAQPRLLAATMRLHMSAADGVINGDVNGHGLFQSAKLYETGNMQNQHIALVVNAAHAPHAVQFRDLKIRRLP